MIALVVGLAWAEMPPPDYRDALMAAAADTVTRLSREEGVRGAADFARRWERQIGEDARLSYELGLASRLAGDAGASRRYLDHAVKLDPTLVAARYDRGEVLLTEDALDAAEVDFREVVRLAPDQWAGHFRLADIAGRRSDPVAFETHLLEALRHGFSFRDVVGDARWRGYLAHAELGPVVRRLALVYQGEEILDELERSAE